MIYLDNSASSFFKPKQVFDAISMSLTAPCNPSRASHKCALKAGALIFNARNTLAKEFNCSSERVIFTSGCTEALNTAIFGLHLKGHVITTVFEHNSVLRPLYELRKRGMIDLSFVASPSQAAHALRSNTRLLAINHVSNVTGQQADLAAYAQVASRANALLLVDAAQSAGYTKIDLKHTKIDMLAVASHKGLHGIQGAGALCLSTNPLLSLTPTKYGGTGAHSSSTSQPNDFPEGFEAGTPPTPAICAMAAGLEYTMRHQKENAEKLLRLSADLIKQLNALGARVYSLPNIFGIVAFKLCGISSQEAGDLYNSFDIALRCGYHCAPLAHQYLNTNDGLIRASLGIDSTIDDVEALITATKSILRL